MSDSTNLSAPAFVERIRSQDRHALATVIEAYLDQIELPITGPFT
jgi:hypothetical protein